MYKLNPICIRFNTELSELKTLLDDLSLLEKSFKRDIYVKGVFLRIVIIWENFIEEAFLRAMCKCETLSGSKLKPKVALSRNVSNAYKKLSQHKKNRDNSYLDWLDYTTLKDRTIQFFHHKSRFNKIYDDPQMLHQIRIIRNHIAHSSQKTKKDFIEKIIQNVGYLTNQNPNVSDYLFLTKRNTNRKFYEIYVEYYEYLASEICK